MSYLFALVKQSDGVYKGTKIVLHEREDVERIIQGLIKKNIDFKCETKSKHDRTYYEITITS